MDLQRENIIEVQKIKGKVYYLKFCYACGEYYKTARIDKLTCSSQCKQRHGARTKKSLPPIVDKSMRDKPTKELLKKFGFENFQE